MSAESDWFEFKVNNSDPTMIGQSISALANSARLIAHDYAYMIWGVRNDTHEVVGTSFKPENMKAKGNEDLVPWLNHKVRPTPWFEFLMITVADFDGQDCAVVVCEIEPADQQPVAFDGNRWIRVASVTKRLESSAPYEKQLWEAINSTGSESLPITGATTRDRVFELLDYELYLEQIDQAIANPAHVVIDQLVSDRLVVPDGNRYKITSLGALLYARDLDNFPRLRKKKLRLIRYNGPNRLHGATHDVTFASGYARSLNESVTQTVGLAPTNEAIRGATRVETTTYPAEAIRELVANAVIHQDLAIRGSAPTIELFSDRLEISNPGEPLVDVLRFLDTPPRSRNESAAAILRRVGLCEERGSGIDKVVHAIEVFQLPAPLFEVKEDTMVATLFAPLKGNMPKKDRNRALYLHACLRHVGNERLTNESVRERLNKDDASTVSRYIKDAVEAQLIAPFDENASRSKMSYVPFWAKS